MRKLKRTNPERYRCVWLAVLLCLALVAVACRGGADQSTPTPPPIGATETPEANGEVNLGIGPALVWGGDGSYGVVLVHGAIYDAASWTEQAEAIATAGFPVVAVENATEDDTRAAMDYLRRSFGVETVALVGASAGTGPVLAAATGQPPESRPTIDLVVVLAGSGDVAELSVPSVLFISAAGDSGAAGAAERMLGDTSGDPNDLLIVPGSAHAQALFDEPEGAQVLSRIIERLTERQNLLTTEP